MKICRWTFQQIIWAALFLLCFCGNVADDHVSAIHHTITDKQDLSHDQVNAPADKKLKSTVGSGESFIDPTVITKIVANVEAGKNVGETSKETENVARQQDQVIKVIDEVAIEKVEEVRAEKEEMKESSTSQNSSLSKEDILFLNEEKITMRSIMNTGIGSSLPSYETVDAISINADTIPITEKPNLVNIEEAINQTNSTHGADQTLKDGTIYENTEALLETNQNTLENGVPVASSEEMPSFNEWAKKRLEEQEKNGLNPATGTSQTSKISGKQKISQKNYASTDCGAKVLSTNPEAQGTSAVLGHYTDDYMLNPCVAKIWLVIELCESIQVDRIEMANFELFSSSPKDFSVYSSDRYPTREWKFLGNFVAKDERVLQNFSLDHNTFGKFFKLEIGSHYGSEHFCPLSRLRVYGTSEYEALDTEEPHEDTLNGKSVDYSEDDEPLYKIDSSPDSQNLFGSAKDAVINMVKKAAEVLRSDRREINNSRNNNIISLKEAPTTIPLTLKSSTNCMCIPSLSGESCDSVSVKENSFELLQCEYDSLKYFLTNTWSSFTRRRFHKECAKICSSAEGVNTPFRKFNSSVLKEANENSLCRFYLASFGKTRFDAICKLDKILIDEQRSVSSERPFSNISITPVLDSNSIIFGGSNKKGTNVIVDHEYKSSLMLSSETDETSSSFLTEKPIPSNEGKDQSLGSIPVDKITPTKTLPEDSVPADVGSLDDEVTKEVKENKYEDVGLVDSVSVSLSKLDPSVSQPILTSLGDPDLVSSSVFETSTNIVSSENSEDKQLVESSIVEDYESQGGCSVFPFASESPVIIPEPLQSNAKTDIAPDASGSVYPDTSLTFSLDSNGENSRVSLDGKIVKTDEESGFLPQSMTVAQKESVFVRLTNRIKALELNMSLSSQYLEELSRRYKKQMEEMQKSFNKTILALNETAKMAHERDLKQQEMISTLRSQLDSLSSTISDISEKQKSSVIYGILKQIFCMLIEVGVILALFLICTRSRQSFIMPVQHELDKKITFDKQNDNKKNSNRERDKIKEEKSMKSNTDLKKLRSSSLENIGALEIDKRFQLDNNSRSGEHLQNLGWENLSTSSSSSVKTNSSWQEVENFKKKKRNRNNKGQTKIGLYRSQSNNILDKNLNNKLPIPPCCGKPPLGRKSELNSSAGLLFRSSQFPQYKLVNSQLENRDILNHNNRSKWKNEDEINECLITTGRRNSSSVIVNQNRYASLPHYESQFIDLGSTNLCKTKQTIIDRGPNFNLKKSYTEVCG